MSIAEKLTQLNTVKQNIKSAIEQKGVTVGSAPFTQYPAKILEIETGGGGDTIVYNYPLVKVQEENWNSLTKEDNTLYAIV